MRRLLICLALTALACGVQAQAPQILGSVGNSYQAPSLSAAPVPSGGQVMTVTADEAVYIRLRPDPDATIVGWLENGQTVIVTRRKKDDYGGQWCRHIDGWTNCRYLEDK